MGESWGMPLRRSLHSLSPFFWRRSCRWVRRCKDLPDTELVAKSSYKLFLQLRLSTRALHPVTSANCGRAQLLLIPCAGPQQCSFKTERAGSCTQPTLGTLIPLRHGMASTFLWLSSALHSCDSGSMISCTWLELCPGVAQSWTCCLLCVSTTGCKIELSKSFPTTINSEVREKAAPWRFHLWVVSVHSEQGPIINFNFYWTAKVLKFLVQTQTYDWISLSRDFSVWRQWTMQKYISFLMSLILCDVPLSILCSDTIITFVLML
jgi:hypothetical protein